jgi:hypothetical protein
LAQVFALPSFLRKAKKFAGKFPSLVGEIEELVESLKIAPLQGAHLGSGLYKIRLASESKGKGKSGVFRVISYYLNQTEAGAVVYLVTMYDKSEEDSISRLELKELIRKHLG